MLPALLAEARDRAAGARRPQRRRLDRAHPRERAPGRAGWSCSRRTSSSRTSGGQHRGGARDVRDHGPAASGWRATTATPSAPSGSGTTSGSRPSSAPGTSRTCSRGVTAPTLLIQGEHDQYGTLAQIDAIERGVQGPVHARRARLPARAAPRGARGDAGRGARRSWHDATSSEHFVVAFEGSFDARYGLEYLSPTHGRVTIARRAARRRRHRAERHLRGDRRVAGVDRDRRRGRPAGLLPVRSEQRHARRRRGPRGRSGGASRVPRARRAASGCGTSRSARRAAPPTAIATVVIAVRESAFEDPRSG